jgi:hypothetical protein
VNPAARAVLHLAEPPPPALLCDEFPTRDYPAASEVFRSHRQDRGPCWFSHSGEGRFDLAAPQGTCYVAESEVVTLLETWGGLRVVPDYVVAERNSSYMRVMSDVRVADFTSNLAVQYGITAEAFTITDYARTQLWAGALSRAGFGGIRYWARHDLAHTAACLALFGPADPGAATAEFAVVAADHLPTRTDLLDQLEQETGITVLPVPPL